MSVEVLIKFAPVHTLERHNSPTWNRAGRSLYETGSLRFAPGRSTVPLLVDHHEEREVGVVHKIFKGDWSDGPFPSLRAAHLHQRRACRCRVRLRGVAPQPRNDAAEPLAQVVLVQRADAAQRSALPAGEVTWGHGRIVRRYGGQILGVR